MMPSLMNTAWRLIARPTGFVDRSHFDVCAEPVVSPGTSQVLVRNMYLMVPASMRLWMNAEDTYMPAQPLGEVMRGLTTGVVEISDDPRLPVGTYVNGLGGWQKYYLAAVEELRVLEPHPDIPLSAYRTVLDFQGLTAYCGLIDVCKPVAGETLVVTSAAGSVGSLVCQIGKKLGLRVVGIAGGPTKCDWLRAECGVDFAIDYKNDDVGACLDEMCPDGVDILFENVGGPVMDLLIDRITLNARIALCGLVSTYNGGGRSAGRSLMNLVNQRGTMRGFIVLDYIERLTEVTAVLTSWILDGSLTYQEEFLDGLDRAPEAMNRLANGDTRGNQVVRID